MATRMLDLAIVTPVFNDFEAFWTLCARAQQGCRGDVCDRGIQRYRLRAPSDPAEHRLGAGARSGDGCSGVRVATDFSIPGWASNIVGISAIMLFQAVTLSVVASLTMLASRSGAVFIPAFHAGEYVDERIALSGKWNHHQETSNISALS